MRKLLDIAIIKFLFLLVFIGNLNAASFDENIKQIRAEINKDNLTQALKILENIKISNEREQDQINVLFGDIYLKINKPSKAEEFYQKSFFTTDRYIESLSMLGLAEVRLYQGRLDDAVKYAKQALSYDDSKIRPNVVYAIAKTRLGEAEEAINVLNQIYQKNKLSADVSLAIANYYSVFEDHKQAIAILEEYLKRIPNNIKVLDHIGNLYLMIGEKDKALEAKFKVFKYYEYIGNRKKITEVKGWILSVDPNYFDKPEKVEKIEDEIQDNYEQEEISNYDEDYSAPYYEQFEFAGNSSGSGFIVGKGNYVITNYHVIHGAKKVAVRNGLGKVTNAKVINFSKKFDLALLELDKNYSQKISIETKDFKNPRPGEDVITIGFPGIGETFWQPTITQGIVSKVFSDNDAYPGTFMTTIAINSGNSGGPIFNLSGNLVGVAYAALDKEEWVKAGILQSLPTDMGYAIQSRMINKVIKYDQNEEFKKAKYSRADLYEKMLPSVVLVAVLRDE